MTNVARKSDPFGARQMFETGAGKAALYRLTKLEELGLARIAELPFSIRVLLESALRNCDGFEVTEDDVKHLAGWKPTRAGAGRNPLQAGPGAAAGLHRRAAAWSIWRPCGRP